jgi:uncharacterized protein (TIGR00297 family)
MNAAIGAVWAGVVSALAFKKKSLSLDGAVAAWITGTLMTAGGIEFALCLLWFFVTSTIATRLGKRRKRQLEGDTYHEFGNRNWVQVVSNSLPATLASAQIWRTGNATPLLTLAIVASVSQAIGDTWASEIGSVFGSSSPLLITTLQRVPAGTNGGVSAVGIVASIVGGASVGLVYVLAASALGGEPSFIAWLTIGAVCGFVGSMIDSLLGATLQLSMFDAKKRRVVSTRGAGVVHVSGVDILDNHQVNLVSNCSTALLAMAVGAVLFAK